MTRKAALNMIKHMDGLPELIVAARKRKARTLRTLATEANISPALLSLIERGKHRPSKEILARLAGLLDADPDQWCGLLGKLTPEAERCLAAFAKDDPRAFRRMMSRYRN